MFVSVIMSTYNEKYEELNSAVQSILGQSYSDFEFIIICHNPDNKELIGWLNNFKQSDDRIKLIFNDTNLGLPKSLNKGIDIAQGKYIARMDADDISMTNRLQMQLEHIIAENADLVSTNGISIYEGGTVINKLSRLPSNHQINRILPVANCIFHPSVLMKKEVLCKLGGYRLFNTAQDYDLWLRFLSNGYNISCLNEYLIYYRLRSTSISKVNRFKQFLTNIYIRKLYNQRIKTKKVEDDFTEDNYLEFLTSKKLFDKNYNDRVSKAFALNDEGIKMIRNRNIKGFYKIISGCIQSKYAALSIYNVLKYKILKAIL